MNEPVIVFHSGVRPVSTHGRCDLVPRTTQRVGVMSQDTTRNPEENDTVGGAISSRVIALFVVAVAVVVGYFALGMRGMGHGGSGTAGIDGGMDAWVAAGRTLE